jgi:hypothetical protein
MSNREGQTLASLVDGAMGAAQQRFPALEGQGSGVVDYTKRLLLGYVLKHLLMTDDELAEAKDHLEQFARVEGYAMGTIYVEDNSTTPAAFEALIDAVNRYEVTTVIIPSRLHFAALAVTHDVKDTFERTTGARVVVANPSP